MAFLLLLLILVAGVCKIQFAQQTSFGGYNNPYEQFPIKRDPSMDDKPLIIRRPKPTILLLPETAPVATIEQLQQELTQEQQKLARIQQANEQLIAQSQQRISSLEQQIKILKISAQR